MSISSLLNGGRRGLHHKSEFDQRHLSEGGLDMKASSHDLDPAEELNGQVTSASTV